MPMKSLCTYLAFYFPVHTVAAYKGGQIVGSGIPCLPWSMRTPVTFTPCGIGTHWLALVLFLYKDFESD